MLLSFFPAFIIFSLSFVFSFHPFSISSLFLIDPYKRSSKQIVLLVIFFVFLLRYSFVIVSESLLWQPQHFVACKTQLAFAISLVCDVEIITYVISSMSLWNKYVISVTLVCINCTKKTNTRKMSVERSLVSFYIF